MTLVSPADGSLLRAVRETLGHADTALLCVAFVADAGVNLVREELRDLAGSARLLATTAFGTTTASALTQARRLGTGVRTLNPPGSATYHPKLYLGRTGSQISAVVGSANLTRGLVCNIELACHFKGTVSDKPMVQLWEWGEALWAGPAARPWDAAKAGARSGGEALDRELETLLRAEVARDPTFPTLGPTPSPNLVREVVPQGLYVETPRSRALGRSPQEIPAWMINLAWGYLRTHGELSNMYLLNELRVHRSSAVCALLERLPGVRRGTGRQIRLVWKRPEASA